MTHSRLISGFSTPILSTQWTEAAALNLQLAAAITQRVDNEQKSTRSNVGGWHSDLDFLRWSDGGVDEFRRRLMDDIQSLNEAIFEPGSVPAKSTLRLDAWANVLNSGGYNSLHAHPNSFWSGVYYVNGNESVPEHPYSGKLELIDPRPAASVAYVENTKLSGRFLVNPSAGQLVVFPSWLQHCVHPYHGSEPRISIAFNVQV